MDTDRESRQLDVAILGAGFGGICTAIRLKQAGVTNFTIFERGDDVGGTWRDNNYPGAAVDISVLQYCYSFMPNAEWSRLYATQPELLHYIRSVTDHFELRRHLQLNTEVTELAWDGARRHWCISTRSGELVQARVVVSATGILSQPQIPQIPGLSQFGGETFHSARWNHDIPLKGRRVAVVGSGASAIQFVPAIVGQVGQMTVFQRSAPWVYPRGDRPIAQWERWAHRRIPGLMVARRAIRWLRNDLVQWGLQRNGRLVQKSREAGMAHIAAQVRNPELRRAVTPDYEPGCKRRVISDDWYQAIQRSHVAVIPAGLDRIEGRDTLVATDGTRVDADVIIFGTGFSATSFLSPMKVRGRDGLGLEEHWRFGAATHLGITVSGFPNLFVVFGPNTGLGNNSALFMIECQARYIARTVKHMKRRHIQVLELLPKAERDSYWAVQRKFQGTVYTTGCHGWYQSADGHIDTLWPSTTAEYWWRTRRFDSDRYAAETGFDVF